MVLDSLIVIGLATVSLGTIQEADGVQEHTFLLRNAGNSPVAVVQTYTSCHCTTVEAEQPDAGAAEVLPGDTIAFTLRFNPQGKGGDFEETGTIVYGATAASPLTKAEVHHVQLSLTGTCITSEESLLRQFPIRVSDRLRLSANRFDLGIMHVGETKQRTVVLLHRDDGDRREPVTVTFSPSADTPKGLQHIDYPIGTPGQEGLTIRLDVVVK